MQEVKEALCHTAKKQESRVAQPGYLTLKSAPFTIRCPCLSTLLVPRPGIAPDWKVDRREIPALQLWFLYFPIHILS